MHNNQITSIALVVVIVILGLYRRIRRTIGFQQFRERSLWTRIILFSILGVLFLAVGVTIPRALIGDLAGIIIGGVLVYFAARTTTFESRNGVWFYRPNPWIGAFLIVLFVGRLAYRYVLLMPMYAHMATQGGSAAMQQSQSFNAYAKDPWTTGVFFILIAYYIGYNWFILRREKNLEHPGQTARHTL